MGVPIEQARRCRCVADAGHRFLLFPLLVFSVSLILGSASGGWALQSQALPASDSHVAQAASGDFSTASFAVATAGLSASPTLDLSMVREAQAMTSESPHGAPSVPGVEQQSGAAVQEAHPQEAPHAPAAPKGQAAQPPAAIAPAHPKSAPAEVAKPEHGAAPSDTRGGHGSGLPEISPIPGVTFVETMINLMDYELHGRTLGWRPNDIILGRFTDNINNYQLGVLEALRFTTLRLKDSLTRMGDADAYDPDLEQALNLLMNRATLFWFPSAETAYGEAVDHLRNFVQKLKTGQRNFYYRVDNLRSLISSYKDLLGNVNRSLIRDPVSWFQTDDYFYYAKGVAHVYYEILRVVRVGYQSQLASTLNALDIMDEIIHELHRADQADPWIILDSDLDGLFANHRANLNAPLSEVSHLLGVMTSF